MIELLAGLIVHAAFLEAKESNRRIAYSDRSKECHHGRSVLQSCWNCPREIAVTTYNLYAKGH